jgi:benzoylformate decarboxylase
MRLFAAVEISLYNVAAFCCEGAHDSRNRRSGMAEMSGAEAMFEIMVREGVRYVFGNPGTTELPLMDLFAAHDEIEYVLALHEDSALGMAAGYADATGSAAVVNLHTNPGVAHALANLYNAYRTNTPLIVTAGQQDTRAMIDDPLLCADLLQLTRQHTKWVWEAHHASEVPAVMARAFKTAQTPPTGPVFVSLPVNVMEERAEIELPPVTRIGSRIRGDKAAIEVAAGVLAAAKSPAILAGDGCARSGAVRAIVSLAEALAAPVYTEPLSAYLNFPTGHPLYAGALTANARQARSELEGADVLLIIGARNLAPLVYTGVRMIPGDASLIQIDVDAAELGKAHAVEIALLGDPRSVVEELVEALGFLPCGATEEGLSRRRELLATNIQTSRAKFIDESLKIDESGLMSPCYVAREMRVAASNNAVLVDESITSSPCLRAIFELNEPDSYFHAKAGALGMGIPVAIGVKLAMPDRQVLCAVGDGCALYAVQALWTAARYKVAVVFIVFNNTSYMVLKGGLLALAAESVKRGVFTGMDITEPEIDFAKLAESMGVAGRRVSRAGELRPALDWALGETGPTLLDVRIARGVRSTLR